MRLVTLVILTICSTSLLACEFCLVAEINGSPCTGCAPEGWDVISSSPDLVDPSLPSHSACTDIYSEEGGTLMGLFAQGSDLEGVEFTFEDLTVGFVYYFGFEAYSCGLTHSSDFSMSIGDFYEEYSVGEDHEFIYGCFVAEDDEETLTIQMFDSGGSGHSYLHIDHLPCGLIDEDKAVSYCDGRLEIELLEEVSLCPDQEHQLELISNYELDGTEIIEWTFDPDYGENFFDFSDPLNPVFYLPPDADYQDYTFTITVEITKCDLTEEASVDIHVYEDHIPEFEFELCSFNELYDLPTLSIDGYTGYWDGEEDCFEDFEDEWIELTFYIDSDQENCLLEYTYEFYVNSIIEPEFNFQTEYCTTDSFKFIFPEVSDNDIEGYWEYDDIKPYRWGEGEHENIFYPEDEDNQCASLYYVTITVIEKSNPDVDCPFCYRLVLEDSPCTNCVMDGWSACGFTPDIVLGQNPLNNFSCAGAASDGSASIGLGSLNQEQECVSFELSGLIPGVTYFLPFEISSCQDASIQGAANLQFNINQYYETIMASESDWRTFTFCFRAQNETETLEITNVSNYPSYALIDAIQCAIADVQLSCGLSNQLEINNPPALCPGESYILDFSLEGIQLDGTQKITWECDPPQGLTYLSNIDQMNSTVNIPTNGVVNAQTLEYGVVLEYHGCTYFGNVDIDLLSEIDPQFQNLTFCENQSIDNLPLVSDNGFTGSWDGIQDFTGCGGETKTFVFYLDAGQANCLESKSIDVFINVTEIPEFNIIQEYCSSDASMITMPQTDLNGINGTWTLPEFSPVSENVGTLTNTFMPDGITFPCAENISIDISIGIDGLITFDLSDAYCLGESFAFPMLSLDGYEGLWTTENIYDFSSPGTYSNQFTTNDLACGGLYIHEFQIIDIEHEETSTAPTECNAFDAVIYLDHPMQNLFEYSIDGGNNWGSESQFTNLDYGVYVIQYRLKDRPSCRQSTSVVFDGGNTPQLLDLRIDDRKNCLDQTGDATIVIEDNSDIEFSIDDGLTWQQDTIIPDLDEGSYELWYRYAGQDECYGVRAFEIQTLSLPDNVLIGVEDLSDCDITDGSIAIEATGLNLEFSIDAGVTWSQDSLFQNLDEGIYEIVIRTHGQDDCIMEENVTILSPTIPDVSSTVTHPSSCMSSDGLIELEILNSDPVEFSIDSGDTWQQLAEFSNLGPGIYSIEYRTIGKPNCNDQFDVSLESPDIPIINEVRTDDDVSCIVDNGSITLIVDGPDVEFSIDNAATWQRSNIFEELTSGDYEILIRPLNDPNCILSATATIDEATLPEIDGLEVIDISDCNLRDGSVEILGSEPGLEFSIDNGDNWQDIPIFSDLDEGNYDLIIRNAEYLDCELQFVFEILNPDCPCDDYNLIADQQNIDCQNTEGIINIELDSGESILWESGEIAPTLNDLSAGSYSFTITYQENLCEYIDSIQVLETEAIDFGLNVLPNDCLETSNGQVEVTNLSGGTGEYNYSIDGINFQSQSGFYNLSTDEYEAYVSDLNGCITFAEFSIELASAPLNIDLLEVTTIELGDTIYLNPLIDINSVNSFEWEDRNNILELDGLVAQVSPTEDTEYTLTINYGNDCVLTRTILIRVIQNINIYIPNIISNNGSNNDMFFIQSNDNFDITIDALQIFDRWGNRVFINEAFKVNDPSEGWDGRQGYEVIQGVYTYKLEYTLDKRSYQDFGTLTLIK